MRYTILLNNLSNVSVFSIYIILLSRVRQIVYIKKLPPYFNVFFSTVCTKMKYALNHSKSKIKTNKSNYKSRRTVLSTTRFPIFVIHEIHINQCLQTDKTHVETSKRARKFP